MSHEMNTHGLKCSV